MKPGNMSLQKRLVWGVLVDVMICAIVFLLFAHSPNALMMVLGTFIFLQFVPLFFLMKDFLVKLILFRLEKDAMQKDFFDMFNRFDFPKPDKTDQPVKPYLQSVARSAEDNEEAAAEAAKLEGYLQALNDVAGPQMHNHMYRNLQFAMNQYYELLDSKEGKSKKKK